MKWFRQWIKARDALADSQERLAQTQRIERTMEPKLSKIERALKENHIYDSVTSTLKSQYRTNP